MSALTPHPLSSAPELPPSIPESPPAARGRGSGVDSPHEMTRWRDAVLEVQSAILSGATGDALLHTVADVARRLADADVATVAVPHVVGTSLVLRAAAGYREDELRGVVFPVEESLSGQILTTGRAVHLIDARRHANAYQPICELGDMGPTLLLPLACGAAPFGTLLVSRRCERVDFADRGFELLRTFAGHVSVMVEFCRGQEGLQRLARVEDSERVGRELHDTVLQRLFGIGLRLQTLSSDGGDAVGAQVQSVLDELDATVREIRFTVLETEPGPDAGRASRVGRCVGTMPAG